MMDLQKVQNKCIRFCLNLPPRSHIDPSHLRKINWPPFLSIGKELCWDIFRKCLSLHSADTAQDHR